MVKILSVTEFVRLIDDTLAEYQGAVVEGEVGEFNISQGKWIRFSLKDKESSVRCFMPKWYLKVEIEDGMQVQATGKPTLTQKYGFSFNVTFVQPAGEGALKRAFELLKKKLTQEGLFEPARKRPLPRFPQHVALVTSREAAAYGDFLKVLAARMGGLTVSFIHTQVQGKEAPQQIIAALEQANTELTSLDAIILVRGGGSLEDLQAFNNEAVIRAVAASRTPIIVGVGHERDVTLAEMAADRRASTPSNAAELLVRSREEMAGEVAQLRLQLRHCITLAVTEKNATVRRTIDILRGQIRAMDQGLKQLLRVLTSLSPRQVLKRGYSITRGPGGRVIKDSSKVTVGDTINTQLAEGTLDSSVVLAD